MPTCPHCKTEQPLNKAGYIAGHSWPPPTRQLCRGSGYSSVEDTEQALAPCPKCGQVLGCYCDGT